MAYNFYNVGIMGEEIKRRLNLLANINGRAENENGDGGVATQAFVNVTIQKAINAINLQSELKVARFDTGVVSPIHIISQDTTEGDTNE